MAKQARTTCPACGRSVTMTSTYSFTRNQPIVITRRHKGCEGGIDEDASEKLVAAVERAKTHGSQMVTLSKLLEA